MTDIDDPPGRPRRLAEKRANTTSRTAGRQRQTIAGRLLALLDDEAEKESERDAVGVG